MERFSPISMNSRGTHTASSDTKMHVAATTMEKLTDYVFHTPEDPLRSPDCVAQRCEMIERNLRLLRG